MPAPFAGKRGWRVIVVYDENSMELDNSLPYPWWTGFEYKAGDIIVSGQRFYRCRVGTTYSGNFNDPANRSNWVDITSGDPDVRDHLPDAVGQGDDPVTVEITPNERIYVDTRNGPVNIRLAAPGSWANGDIVEIVDDYRSFDTNPCTLLNNGIRINYADPLPNGEAKDAELNVVGVQDYWRFIYYINPGNTSDQWLYILSAPTAEGAETKRTPVAVVGPTTEDHTIMPGDMIIARTANGPIKFVLDDSFEDGDTFTVIDYDWSFNKVVGEGDQAVAYEVVLKPSKNVAYQEASDDGAFHMNVKGPNSGWPFLYYGGRVMCMNSPLDQEWIDSVSAALNGDQSQAEAAPVGTLGDLVESVASVAAAEFVDAAPEPKFTPQSFPTFTTTVINSDVPTADPWIQYDVNLGRKKSLTIGLPKVASVPERTRIRVRVISTGRGVVNIMPDEADQILGVHGSLNVTPKGAQRVIHGQYSMIELESHGQDEWMVV